jgi:ABC-2 type transport system ATP-binding protein
MPDKPKTVVGEPEAPVMVRFDDVSKRFGNVIALDGVSFEVRQGEVLGLLGPNGAGKSTAMRILTGYFPPTEGTVSIHGRELLKSARDLKRRIGYLPESIPLYTDMRVREFLEFVADVKGVSRKDRRREVDEKLTQCGLWTVKNRLIRKLSKGYCQRTGLAQALVGNPEVLVLDEPTSSLDPKQIIEIRTLIRELGLERTLILSTHILPEVSMVCDRVIIINKGRIVASGTTDELEADLKERQEIFIVIGDRYRKPEALKLLEGLAGVERVTVTEERQDQVYLSVGAPKGRDIRPEITRLFVQHSIPVLEIRSGRLSLEEIFLRLVIKETA